MKGQYFTLDVIVAALIGIVATVLLIGYWQYSIQNNPLLSDALQKEAITASQLLFSTQGRFAVLDRSAVLVPEAEIRNKVGMLDRSLTSNLCVVLNYQNGTVSSINCKGLKDSTAKAKVERIAFSEETELQSVFVEIYVYR